ncbi:MAG: hypothetical protein MSB10_10955 [Clostridiales bacterium]|uniref:hypothetical protein n=1 Tax=Flavonifractor porci TaxID=3133422 RepID=UPI00309BFA92|nr:hypothetical protein [Clostridiales bacterium]
MSKTKKSRPSVAAPGRQAETGTYGRASTSIYQNTTQPTGRQPGKIERLLSHGAENAVPLQHLVTLTELPARQVRQLIQAERLRGAQILADNQNGYYLPETQEDVELFYKSMLHRAAEITRVATAVKLRGRRLD